MGVRGIQENVMSEEAHADRQRFIEDALKHLDLEGSYKEHFRGFLEKLESDDAALIVLKGHLVLEERLTAVIEKFVFEPDFIDRARLSFAQKVAIARSMSLDQSRNSVWELIDKLNTLRNKLAHSLDGEPRAKALQAVRDAFQKEVAEVHQEGQEDERVLLSGAISMCLGFVHSFEREVERFKDYVSIMNRAINPHRDKKETASETTRPADD